MNAVVPLHPAPANVDAYRASTDAAAICKEIVVATATTIQGRKYVCVEGWQAIAVAHGCAASAREVEAVDGGVRAIGEVRRMSDGIVIAAAEGFVGEDEPTWFGGPSRGKTLPKRPDYAIRAMAQTRAISRACRSAFAHVVVMMNAGLQTTPAEEVPAGGFDDAPRAVATPEPVRPAAQTIVATITDEQRDLLASLAGAKNIPLTKICQLASVPDMRAIPATMFADAKAWIERQKAQTVPPQAASQQASDIIDDDIPY